MKNLAKKLYDKINGIRLLRELIIAYSLFYIIMIIMLVIIYPSELDIYAIFGIMGIYLINIFILSGAWIARNKLQNHIFDKMICYIYQNYHNYK